MKTRFPFCIYRAALAVMITLGLLTVSNTTYSQEKEREVSATSFIFKPGGVSAKLNYFSSPVTDKKNEKITNLVIVVHGTDRNPFTYHKNMRIAADLAGASEYTLVVAPGFIMERDLNANKDLLSDDHVFWTNNGWKQGDGSVMTSRTNTRTVQMSSFEVMDSIVLKILTSGNFPNIRQITIAGNSAGGQYVNRYLAGNLIHDKVRQSFGIEMRYLVAAPSTYTYLTAERPVIGSPGTYYIPADTSCGGEYNNYRHGIENFNEYMSKTGTEKFRSQYGQRQVAYFVGALDNDPNHSQLDRSCAAMLQGRERKERAELFVEYLFHLYGKRWNLTIVPDSGHDHAKMFASEEGQKWLFK